MSVSISFPNAAGFCPQWPFSPIVTVGLSDLSNHVSDPSQVHGVRLMYQIDMGTVNQWVYSAITSSTSSVEFDMRRTPIPIPSNPYKWTDVYVWIQYTRSYNGEFIVLGTEVVFDDRVRGRSGALSDIIATNEIVSYPAIGEDVLEFTRTEGERSSSHPGCLMDDESRSAFEWQISRGGGWYTLEEAVIEGYISIRINTDGFVGSQLQHQAVLQIIVLKAGEYQVRSLGYYKTAAQESTSGYTTVYTQSEKFRVYNPPKPIIEITSVTPAEYSPESSDPLDGLPPYVVTYVDKSKDSDTWQMPQKTIVVDYGDPDSGVDNKSALENESSELVVMSIPSHTYDGYGPYVIQLTIIDKRDRSATYSVSITPNRTPRVIRDPVLTPLQGTQPLIVTGTAYIAGNPLPDVNWKYELLSGDPDYYSGEKSGVYTELSLLAPGTYTVTCSILDGEAAVNTYTFSVEVASLAIHEYSPAKMPDFTIWVRNAGVVVDILQPAEQVRYIQRFGKESVCSFRVPIDYPWMSALRRYAIFDIGFRGIARRMVVESFSESDDYVEISGVELPVFVSRWRVATVATRSETDGGRDVQVCSGESLLRYWLTVNNTGDRAIPDLVVIGENEDRGGRVVYSARYDSVSDILEAICSDSDLGWDSSVQSDGKVGFRIIQGVDRTAKSNSSGMVFFSSRLRNAIVSPYAEYASPNIAIGAGQGNGATRAYTDYGDVSASGISRREIFVDAGDAATNDEVEREANLKLSQQQNDGLYVYPLPDCPWKLGRDYDIGDYITVETKSNLILNLQIIRIEISNYSGEGEVIALYCGSDARTQKQLIRETALANLYAKK